MNSDCCSCQICFSSYDDKTNLPKMLFCGHTLCSLCLDKIPKSENRIKCPICRELMPPNSSFPINYAILKSIEEIKKDRESVCQYHPDYKADHICLIDKQRVCLFCKVYGDHKDHDLIQIEKLKQDVQKKTKEIKADFEIIKKSSQDFSESFEKIKQKLIYDSENSYDQLINLIKQIKAKTTQKICKRLNKALENMKSHDAFSNSFASFTLFEKEMAEVQNKNSNDFASSALAFLAKTFEFHPRNDLPDYQQNLEKSESFCLQITKRIKEQVEMIISTLTNDFNDLEASLSKFNPCDHSHDEETQGKGKINIFIRTFDGPCKMKVDYNDPLETVCQRLKEKGKCQQNIVFYYKNKALKMGCSLYHYNIQKNSELVIKYLPQGNN